MAGFNGSGTFVRVHNWVTDKAGAVKVTASRMDAEDDGFATGLSTAICKDGQTTTTAAVPFAVGINMSDGSVGTPAIKWISDTDSGFYRIGANNVGLSLGGTKVWDYGTATASAAGSLVIGGTLAVTGAIGFANGTVGAPSISFTSDPDTGFYSSAANAMGLALAGAKVIDFNTTGVAVTGTLSASGTLTSTGNFDVNTNKFTVTAASGNATVGGDLAVTGAFALNTNKATISAASGNAALAGNLTVGGTLGVTGNATFTADVSAATISGAVVAAQAGMETGTSTTTVSTPGRQHFHPGHPKFILTCDGSSAVVNAQHSYNYTSTTDSGVGTLDVAIATDFASANYAVIPNAQSDTQLCIMVNNTTPPTAGTFRIKSLNGNSAASTDPAMYSMVAFGDQA